MLAACFLWSKLYKSQVSMHDSTSIFLGSLAIALHCTQPYITESDK